MRAPHLLLALLATLAGPLPALAARLPVPLPPPDGVRAGECVTTAIPALPAGTREFELVLLPEGGPAIAVSPELPAGVASVTWKMPRTFAGRARLALRAGGARDERLFAPSREFALAPPAASDVIALVTGRAGAHAWFGVGNLPGSSWSSAPAPDAWTRAVAASRLAPPPPPPALSQPDRSLTTLVAWAEPPEAPHTSNTFTRTPAWTPLRN